MTTKQVRVGVYARISDDRDGQQTATARQMEDCRAFAERNDWEVVDVFEDIDISAFSTKVKRPEFLRMLEELRSGALDGVIVWKLDRLTRQQRDLVRVTEACEVHKAFIASVTEPINTADNFGQFVAEMLVAQARMESANTSLRQRRKAKQQREQGAPPSNGRRCFGYDARYTRMGYKGGLVPGVTVLGYMSRLMQETFADRWQRGSTFDGRLRRPVYEGAEITVEGTVVDAPSDSNEHTLTVELKVVDAEGQVAAFAQATCRV